MNGKIVLSILPTMVFLTTAVQAAPASYSSFEKNYDIDQLEVKEPSKCYKNLKSFGIEQEINDGKSLQIECRFDSETLVLKKNMAFLSSIQVFKGIEDWARPFIIALYKENPQNEGAHSYCSGVVVGKSLVLTAAHCNPEVGDFIRVDLDDPEGSGIDPLAYKISNVIKANKDSTLFPHGTTDVYGADLAIVEINDQFSSQVRIGQIITSANLTMTTPLKIIGYGKSEIPFEKDIKRSASVYYFGDICKIPPENQTGFKYECTKYREFIAGNTSIGSNACVGDSGGPILMSTSGGNWGILGLVSRGTIKNQGCAQTSLNKAGTIYTLIASYADYLSQHGVALPKSEPIKKPALFIDK